MNGISGTKGYIIANNIASNTVDKLKEAIESGKTVRVDIDKNTYGEARKKGQIYEVLYVCNGKIHDENTAVYFGEIKKYMEKVAPINEWEVEKGVRICLK